MLKIESTIDLTEFYKNYARFKKELTIEMRIALVNTREDFIKRVASIVGTVPAEGGNIPAPYVAFYDPLSWKWMEVKLKHGWMRNIGTATGELLQWLIDFANAPAEIAQKAGFQEVTINLNTAPENIREKIYMMEAGTMWDHSKVPPRPIFRPVVVWYLTQEGQGISPFYINAIKARDMAIARIYGA